MDGEHVPSLGDMYPEFNRALAVLSSTVPGTRELIDRVVGVEDRRRVHTAMMLLLTEACGGPGPGADFAARTTLPDGQSLLQHAAGQIVPSLVTAFLLGSWLAQSGAMHVPRVHAPERD
jgi:hypothetical protein